MRVRDGRGRRVEGVRRGEYNREEEWEERKEGKVERKRVLNVYILPTLTMHTCSRYQRSLTPSCSSLCHCPSRRLAHSL